MEIILYFRKSEDQEKDVKKDPASEAELMAAKQRETIPLEERIQMFKEMLIEKDVIYYIDFQKKFLIFLINALGFCIFNLGKGITQNSF